MAACQNCGYDNPPKTRYCTNCGNDMFVSHFELTNIDFFSTMRIMTPVWFLMYLIITLAFFIIIWAFSWPIDTYLTTIGYSNTPDMLTSLLMVIRAILTISIIGGLINSFFTGVFIWLYNTLATEIGGLEYDLLREK